MSSGLQRWSEEQESKETLCYFLSAFTLDTGAGALGAYLD